jgi:hypothetical protein
MTLYRSKAIKVIVQMEAQPNNEPHIPYSSHRKGPAHKKFNSSPYDIGTDTTTQKNLYNYVVIVDKLWQSKYDRSLFPLLRNVICT